MRVEQVGHEGQVELAVPGGNVVRRHKLPAVQTGRLLQHQLGPLVQVPLLKRQMRRKKGNYCDVTDRNEFKFHSSATVPIIRVLDLCL